MKSHPDVYDAVVVGVPDERWGAAGRRRRRSRARARRPTLESIQEHCRTLIAGYKVPRELHLVDADPALAERQARLPLGQATIATQPKRA